MTDTYYDDENYQDEFQEESYEQGMKLDLWRKLLAYSLRYRFEVAMLALCAVATAICEIAFPLLTRAVIDEVAARGMDARLSMYAGMYGAFVLLIAISICSFIWFGGKIRTHVSYDIRKDGFDNLQRLSFSYYDYRPVGWLMARMTSDCERLSNILAWGMLDLIWGLTMMGGIAIAMLYMDLMLGLAVLSILPFLAWISVTFQKRILKSARNVRRTNSRITGSFNESIMGVQTSKAFVREAENLRNFSDLTTRMYDASVLNRIQAALYLPIVLTLGALATGLALVLGGIEVIGGMVSAGTLVAFLTYARHFFQPVEELAHWFAEMQMAQASAERVISLIESVPDIQDGPDVVRRIRLQARDPQPGAAIDGYHPGIGRIRFENVSFRYESGPPVLSDINLTIDHGENIAVVGSTGGGKTTLVSLLCRFYEPTAGRILIDGVDYRDRSLHWLQSSLGIVLQSSHVFGGSIADNIRYGKLDASREEIMQAAETAGAARFIEELPDGYNQSVGEGGSKLSAGQKQLLSFARAILANPQILVMDEATSSVDTVTEQHIQQGLTRLLRNRISLVIAHRLSTIRNADRILVVEQGRIIEEGSHRQLLAKHGRYHSLYTQQSVMDLSKRQQVWAG